MKRNIILLLTIIMTTKMVNAQNIQHLSADIANPTSFYCVQKQSNWCWAACNQMLLNSQGISETQESQVVKLFGELVNKPAGGNYELAKQALSGTYRTAGGSSITIIPYISYLGTHNDDPIVIINQLNKGIPIVMATRMHGRVCIGIDYDTDGVNYQVTRIRLLNPASSISTETITMQQFLSQNFEGGLTGFMTFNVN